MAGPWNPSLDSRALCRACWLRMDWIVLGLGIFIRVIEFGINRSLWLDEMSLYENLVKTPILALSEPLKNAQLAPPGFLVLERLIAHTLGSSTYSLRLVPLLSGISSLFLFMNVARRILDPRAAVAALTLFALSYDLIYYSTELKQYSSDVALTLGCLLTSLLVVEQQTPRRLITLAILAIAAPWFSHPSVFSIAAMGLGIAGFRAVERRWKDLAVVATIGLASAGSFSGAHAVSVKLLGNRHGMDAFWALRFLKLPITNRVEMTTLLHQLRDVLVNPCNMVWPVFPSLSAGFVAVAFLVGTITIVRVRPLLFALLVLPIGFTALASTAGRYPFHGRLILFLVPLFDLVVVYGLASIPARGWSLRVLLALLLLQPLTSTAYLTLARTSREFDPIGDLHPSPFAESPARSPRPASLTGY